MPSGYRSCRRLTTADASLLPPATCREQRAGSGTRTRTRLRAIAFEATMSTDSIIPASRAVVTAEADPVTRWSS